MHEVITIRFGNHWRQTTQFTLRCFVRSYVTIPTTNKAMTETPANTPKPIGSTSSFFPGGSKVVDAPAGSAVGFGDRVEDKEREERGKDDGEDGGRGNDEDGGKVTVDEPTLSGCGVVVGLGTEEIPYRKELGAGVHWM